MISDLDQQFHDRADAVIQLANAQLADAPAGNVSASCLYAAARFNAWTSARKFPSGMLMAASKAETLDYFVAQYRAMLEENLDWYIRAFPDQGGG